MRKRGQEKPKLKKLASLSLKNVKYAKMLLSLCPGVDPINLFGFNFKNNKINVY
jgi:hypothetical protein